MQLIDIGVNLTNKRLIDQADQIIDDAVAAGVLYQVVTGTSISASQQAIELCQRFPEHLVCTAGVHPHDASEWQADTSKLLRSMLQHPHVRAVGETGLDFNRNFSPPDKQQDVFHQQLQLACDSGKPVFLHQRDAIDAFISILSEYRHNLSDAVAHCFTDDTKTLTRLLDLDCKIGITGWICDDRRGQALQQAVRYIPEGYLMIETDAPYLLPRDLKPKPKHNSNRPQYLPHILNRIAELKNMPHEQLAEQTWSTSKSFFEL